MTEEDKFVLFSVLSSIQTRPDQDKIPVSIGLLRSIWDSLKEHKVENKIEPVTIVLPDIAEQKEPITIRNGSGVTVVTSEKTEPPADKRKTGANFDKVAYQRDYMRKKRAKEKGE